MRAFVNTLDVETGEDALADTAGLVAWLGRNGLLEDVARPGTADLRRAIELREALRRLLLANNGAPVAAGPLAVLDAVARRARVALRFRSPGRAELEPAAGGVDGALGRLLAVVAESMTEGTWARLKVCRAERCRWAFYDKARNRSRAWCSMAVCGNRTKARRYRRRRRARLADPL